MTIAARTDAFISAAIKANQRIYKLLLNGTLTSFYTVLKRGEGGDETYGIDQIAEDIFVEELGSFGKIYSEESGYIGDGEFLITLDPLDGSNNFLSNFPYFGTSVALENKFGIEAGVITNLANGTIMIKNAQRHCYSSLKKLDFKDVVKNNNSKVGIFERAYLSTRYADKLKASKIKYRIPGAVALSLSLSHEVSFVILEGGLRLFDIKAGLYMCEGLYQHKTNDLTIICHQENMFNRLKQILLEDK